MGLVRVEKKCRMVCDHCGDAIDFQVCICLCTFWKEHLKYTVAVLDSFVRKAFGAGLCCLGHLVFCSKN